MLSITLFGCESWCLTEELYGKLRRMYAQHVRAMCRVTRKHTWDHHISTQELGQQLGLDSIDMYIARRQLRWLGHVSRVEFETRLPRRMLSAWVPHRRPIGAPRMTYGRSIFKAFAKFSIDPARWHELGTSSRLIALRGVRHCAWALHQPPSARHPRPAFHAASPPEDV